jgi:hypothetical protein
VLTDSRPIDLAALESKVRVLCDTATAAPDEDRPGLQVVLAEIIDRLDDLTEDLTARHHGQSQPKDEDDNLRRRTQGAYGGDG